MKQWPKAGSKAKYKGTPEWFFFENMIEDANNLLKLGKEYTITKIKLASSWCGVILEEFPDHKFSLSWFDHEKELTSPEVRKIEQDAWEAQNCEYNSLEELRDRNK